MFFVSEKNLREKLANNNWQLPIQACQLPKLIFDNLLANFI
jgi:hypothetical protein